MLVGQKQAKKNHPVTQYLSIRFISWRPSPFRNRSRLELSIRQEQRESKRFSIISCSSAVLGLCRLNTCMTKKMISSQCRARFDPHCCSVFCITSSKHLTCISLQSSKQQPYTWLMHSLELHCPFCCPDCIPTNEQQPNAWLERWCMASEEKHKLTKNIIHKTMWISLLQDNSQANAYLKDLLCSTLLHQQCHCLIKKCKQTKNTLPSASSVLEAMQHSTWSAQNGQTWAIPPTLLTTATK